MDIYINLFPFRKTTLQFVSGFYTFIRCHELSFVVLLFMYLLVYLKKGGKFKFEIYQASLRHHLSQNATKKSVMPVPSASSKIIFTTFKFF